MKRAMCVYLPQWSIQRLHRHRPELRKRPLAIVQPSSVRTARVLACCPRAARARVRPGMPVAEAQALLHTLHLQEDDPQKDRRGLEKLAGWAERFSPLVSVEDGPNPESLILDVTGCAAAFQGEEQLAGLARESFRRDGWTVRIALADTVGAAWALAHYGDDLAAPPGRTEEAVAPLPVAALRLSDGVLQTLAKLGIERIGQLLEWPRSTLPGRLGPEPLRRLDQVVGRVPELIRPCQLPADVEARCSFEHPTDRCEVLLHAIDELLERVVGKLDRHVRGAKHLECWLLHESEPPCRIDVRLFRPTLSTAHLRKLLHTRLERARPTAPVSGICLRVPALEGMPEHQHDFFEEQPAEAGELAALIDRLVCRLGRDAVTFATLVPDPQPEYACRFDPVGPAAESDLEEGVRSRPVLMWPVPEPIDVLALAPEGSPARFRHRDAEHAIRCSWGPERIETGWWRGADVRRDYYVVETESGTRWWIYRCRDVGGWFLHGCFD